MLTEITQATTDDAVELTLHLRHEDAEEIRAAGHDPDTAVLNSVRASGKSAWAVRVDDELLGLYGLACVSCLEDLYTIWALTSTAVERRPKTFYKISKAILRSVLAEHPRLVNMVDARYDRCLRWARHIGFDVARDPQPFGMLGNPFYKIATGGA